MVFALQKYNISLKKAYLFDYFHYLCTINSKL